MDRAKAIELLKQCLDEVPQLRELHHDNQDFVLWFDNARNIIKAALTPDDLKRFSFAQPIFSNDYSGGSVYKSIYLARLIGYETALKSIIQKYEIPGIEEKPATTDITPPRSPAEVAIQLFNGMKLHPDIVTASKSLFRDGHYASAILEAYKAVNNFVKKKTNLALDGKALMSKVFSEDVPVIKLNELLTQSDRDEQEGFKFLFMGAMVGIRNPKAHDNVIQTDPYRTLEYLVFASLLMRRVEESTVVKTSLPRTKWDWDRFLADTKSKCELGIVRLAANLYEFTRSNSDFISWGTGNQDGSFTFRKLRLGGMISIFSMYSCGWIYINFGSLKNKNVPGNIMDSFRDNLNTIQNINIPKESVTNGKFARIYEKPLTNSKNLKLFQDAIISLCQQIE